MGNVRIVHGLSYPAFGRGLVQQCVNLKTGSVVFEQQVSAQLSYIRGKITARNPFQNLHLTLPFIKRKYCTQEILL